MILFKQFKATQFWRFSRCCFIPKLSISRAVKQEKKKCSAKLHRKSTEWVSSNRFVSAGCNAGSSDLRAASFVHQLIVRRFKPSNCWSSSFSSPENRSKRITGLAASWWPERYHKARGGAAHVWCLGVNFRLLGCSLRKWTHGPGGSWDLELTVLTINENTIYSYIFYIDCFMILKKGPQFWEGIWIKMQQSSSAHSSSCSSCSSWSSSSSFGFLGTKFSSNLGSTAPSAFWVL